MLKASFFTKPLAVLLAVLTVAMPCTLNKASANTSGEYAIELLSTGTTTSESTKNAFYIKSSYSKLFNNPSAEYRWIAINHDLSVIKNDTQYHVPAWQANGMGGTVTQIATNSGNEWGHYEDGYLSNLNNFNILNNLTENIWNAAGGSDNMKIWLYDEIGYPSGTANGLTLSTQEDIDKYAAQGIIQIKESGWGTWSTVNKSISSYSNVKIIKFLHAYVIDQNNNILPATVSDTNVSFSGTSGRWTLYIFAIKELYEGTHAQTNSSGNDAEHYINLMSKDAVNKFIQTTYQAYADNYKNSETGSSYFSQVIGVFTDEPSLMEKYQNTDKTYSYAQLSWVDGFDTEFEKMHGYSILDNLHHVFEGTSDAAKIVRVNYRQTVAKLVSENYFKQLADFCEEHGTALTGHGVLEERLYDHVLYYGDLMQSLRQMQIPGVDVLFGNPDDYFKGGIFMSTKYATSTKTLTDNDRMTMVEFAPTDGEFYFVGDSSYLTESSRYNFLQTLNLLLFQGVTNITSYIAIEQFAETVKERREITDYLARLTYMSRQAQWDGDIGLYYPINTSQAYSVPSNNQNANTYSDATYIDEVAKAIYANNMDFTVVDNQFLIEAKIDAENDVIYNDYVSFKAIVMPAVEVISYDAVLKLVEFQNAGGKVYWLKTIPNLIDISADHVTDYEERLKISNFIDVLKLEIEKNFIEINDKNTTQNAIAQIMSAFSYGVETSNSNVYVGKYKIDGSTMFWVYNYNDSGANVTLSNSLNAKSFDVYDPTTGEIQTISADNASVYLSGNSAKLIIVNEVEMYEYVRLNGKVIYLIVYKKEKNENVTYSYNNVEFFWSDDYDGYCTLVECTADIAPDTSSSNFVMIESPPKDLVLGKTDINGTGKVDLNDAQFVWNMYNGVYDGSNGRVTLEKFLYADVNGDKKIDVNDCVAIVNSIPEEELEEPEETPEPEQ